MVLHYSFISRECFTHRSVTKLVLYLGYHAFPFYAGKPGSGLQYMPVGGEQLLFRHITAAWFESKVGAT